MVLVMWKVLRQTSLILVLAAIFVALSVACGDSDDGFRDDPREENQRGDPGEDLGPQGEFIEDPRNVDSPQPVAEKPEQEQQDAASDIPEGKLPDRMHGDRTHGIWPQVWSQHAPGIQSWEYKVNCGPANSHTDPCFLSDLTSVVVTTPSGELIELEKDFNTNDFSGEVTRRWVIYGPEDGDLPEQGDYVFSYSRGSELLYEQAVPYDSGVISYPTEVEWRRSANDIVVNWNPPAEAAEGMHYKALIWQVEDTPELFISDVFEWNSDEAVLQDVPMIEGGNYSLNVAIFFDDGYAYSEYVIFEWPERGESGY